MKNIFIRYLIPSSTVMMLLLSLNAYAGNRGNSNLNKEVNFFTPIGEKVVCHGFVMNPVAQLVPIEIAIQWGKGLYDALTTLTIDDHSGSYYNNFQYKSGSTRCEFWKKSTAMLTLDHGAYAYNLEIYQSWSYSECGQNSHKTFLSDTTPGGPNQKVELTCK